MYYSLMKTFVKSLRITPELWARVEAVKAPNPNAAVTMLLEEALQAREQEPVAQPKGKRGAPAKAEPPVTKGPQTKREITWISAPKRAGLV